MSGIKIHFSDSFNKELIIISFDCDLAKAHTCVTHLADAVPALIRPSLMPKQASRVGIIKLIPQFIMWLDFHNSAHNVFVTIVLYDYYYSTIIIRLMFKATFCQVPT